MIVLDTHTAVWASTDKTKLSPAAAEALREERRMGGIVALASSSLWEIAMMATRGRYRLPITLSDYLRYAESAFVILPITGLIAERSMLFSSKFPNDPTDRLIAATAVVHGAKLVTVDKKIRRSKEVDCVW